MDWIQTVLGRDLAEMVVSACRKYQADSEPKAVSITDFRNQAETLYEEGWRFTAVIDDNYVLLERRKR